MAGSILGNAVVRIEDPELLRGRATYIDNLDWPGKLYMHFVRSTSPHGMLRSVDVAEARAVEGVAAVFTAADLGLAPHQIFVTVADAFARPPLAIDRVRFVGEPVVAILAESRRAAADAADTVVIDIEALPPIVDPEAAFDTDQPVLFPDHGSNLAFSNLDPYDDDFFADADVVVRGRYENQRIAVVPM
jgi:carbon-monoxide dehydrogenase large subunit